jgi:hypothetical protein
MGEKGFVFSLTRFRWSLERTASDPEAGHRVNNYFLSNSLIPFKNGTGIPNQTNLSPLLDIWFNPDPTERLT